MKTLKLIALVALAFTFSRCKTPTQVTNSSEPSMLEVQQILLATNAKFLQYADTTNGNPWQAIMLTTNWVKSQLNVQSAEALDSTYINIVLKSGLMTTFSFDQVDDSGRSIFKGGGKDIPGAHVSVSGSHSKNTITNKKVLIYSAGNQDFYKNNEIQSLYNIFKSSSLGLDVTLLIDEQCTPEMVDHFGDYGLVILDTHGNPETFMSGIIIEIDTTTKTTEQIKQAILKQQGQVLYDRLLTGDYICVFISKINNKIPNWQKRQGLASVMRVFVSTKHIDKLPEMPGTVIFGSMCYSGYQTILPNGYTPMNTSWMNKKLISYYSFAFNNGSSTTVNAVFAKKMEDSLADAFVIDFDSTKIVHFKPDHKSEYSDPTVAGSNNLWFRHFGADDYSYSNCDTEFTDSRDGKKYKVVCIGNQTWMAENLRYDAPGSVCYNDDAANCDIYGKLYNWNTVMAGASASTSSPSGVKGICPKGWHLPSQAEWNTLFDNLGGPSLAGGAMRSTSALWQAPNTGATNSSGFSAEPGGLYYFANTGVWKYTAIGQLAFWWTTSQSTSANPGPTYTKVTGTDTGISNIGFGASQQEHMNCRCLKD